MKTKSMPERFTDLIKLREYFNERRNIVMAAAVSALLLAGAICVVSFAQDDGQPVALEARVIQSGEQVYEPPMDFTRLKAQNPDVVGWISAPLLGIDEPILQADDNDEYLTKSFEGGYSHDGAVFLDYESDPSFLGKHSVVYGHNFERGGAFSPLVTLKDAEEFERCRDDITIYTPERAIPLRITAVGAARADSMRRKTVFLTRGEFRAYADSLMLGCKLTRETGDYERLYSFITCSYEGDDYRTYVYAVER